MSVAFFLSLSAIVSVLRGHNEAGNEAVACCHFGVGPELEITKIYPKTKEQKMGGHPFDRFMFSSMCSDSPKTI